MVYNQTQKKEGVRSTMTAREREIIEQQREKIEHHIKALYHEEEALAAKFIVDILGNTLKVMVGSNRLDKAIAQEIYATVASKVRVVEDMAGLE